MGRERRHAYHRIGEYVSAWRFGATIALLRRPNARRYSRGSFCLNSVVGMVIRYTAAPVGSCKSNLPPMLGGPSCPPRNMTDRSVTAPFIRRPPRFHCHRPEANFVGAPIAKRMSTVNVDDPSPKVASASRRSPARVPRTCVSVNEERFSCPLRSSIGGCGGLAHAAMKTIAQYDSKRRQDTVP